MSTDALHTQMITNYYLSYSIYLCIFTAIIMPQTHKQQQHFSTPIKTQHRQPPAPKQTLPRELPQYTQREEQLLDSFINKVAHIRLRSWN